MAKKMHDILSPKAKRKIDNTVKDLVKGLSVEPLGRSQAGEAKKKRVSRKKVVQEPVLVKHEPVKHEPAKPALRPKKERRFPLKEVVIGSVVVLGLLGWYGATKLPKVDIEIWPKTETLTFSQKINADKSATIVDSAKAIIPATYLEETKDGKQEFLATGSASDDGKATGSIRIYNKTESVFTLVKGTHFLSDSGKYFVTTARISIPAMVRKTPGSAVAEVIAKEAGEDHNIGPSKFFAPKLSGTAYYYNIYAQSTTDMTGGHVGKVKKVTADDIKEAKDSLTKKLFQEAKDSLQSRLSEEEVLLDGAIQNIIVSDSADVIAGAIAEKFNESVSVKVSALVVKKQDLRALVRANVTSKLSAGDNFIEESLDIKPSPTSLDIKTGKMALDTDVSVKTYQSVDINELVNLFATKNGDQIKQIVDQMHEGQISELKINFWPFWVHNAPDNKNRINVDLKF